MAPAMMSCRTTAIQHKAMATAPRSLGTSLRTVVPRSQIRSRFSLQATASPDILEKVKGIVGKQLGVDDDKVKEDSKFVDDLGADSLDAVEMVMALEDEFGVEIGEESAEKLASVQEAADAIAGELEKKK